MPDTSTPDEISIPGDDIDFPDDDMPDNDDIPGSNPSKLTPDPDFKGV